MGSGTSLTFLVTASKGCIVGIDYANCKLIAFRDDIGKDLGESFRKGLLDKVRGNPNPPRWVQGQQGGADRNVWRIMVGSPDMPSEGALAITLKGKVAFVFSAKEKTAKVKDIELKAGRKLDFGGIKMEITAVPDGWMGGMPVTPDTTSFGIKWEQEGEILKELRFLRADGTEIQAMLRGSSQNGNEGRMSVSRFFVINEKIAKVSVSVTYFDETRRVGVPIDITTGVGF
jgi:hypothetical protein